MVFGLAHQLSVWLKHLTDMGDVNRECKYSSKVLMDVCDRYIQKFAAMDDEIYEHSVQISELFEAIAKMDQDQIDKVIQLVTELSKQNTTQADDSLASKADC